MSSNPYRSPEGEVVKESRDVASRVRGPATALIVVSSFSIFLFVIGLCFSAVILFSGAAAQLPERSSIIDRETTMMIRMGWGVIIIIANIVILLAAINMWSLKNYRLSNLGAVLAVIPCIGPCYLLGIPFGIWALVILNQLEIKEAFRS